MRSDYDIKNKTFSKFKLVEAGKKQTSKGKKSLEQHLPETDESVDEDSEITDEESSVNDAEDTFEDEDSFFNTTEELISEEQDSENESELSIESNGSIPVITIENFGSRKFVLPGSVSTVLVTICDFEKKLGMVRSVGRVSLHRNDFENQLNYIVPNKDNHKQNK